MLFKILHLPQRLRRVIWRYALVRSLGDTGTISSSTRIASPELIHVFGDSARLSIEPHVEIESGTVINCSGKLSIGSNTYISVRGLIGCEAKVSVGKNVLVGPNVTIIDTNKNYKATKVLIRNQGFTSKPIVIDDDCWIGANAVILPGVNLGKHCVVAAGSVVSGHFEPNTLLAGNPAKIIKHFEGAANVN